MLVRLALPYLECAVCGRQLVTHIHVTVDTASSNDPVLLCLVCAASQPAEDVVAVHPDGPVRGDVAVMDPSAAVDMFLALGAHVEAL